MSTITQRILSAPAAALNNIFGEEKGEKIRNGLKITALAIAAIAAFAAAVAACVVFAAPISAFIAPVVALLKPIAAAFAANAWGITKAAGLVAAGSAVVGGLFFTKAETAKEKETRLEVEKAAEAVAKAKAAETAVADAKDKVADAVASEVAAAGAKG